MLACVEAHCVDPIAPISLLDSRVNDCAEPILAVDDMTPAGDQDPTLSFAGSSPLRYYVMRLRRRPAVVASMTRHQSATQCLASADSEPWWIVMAPPDCSASDLSTSDLRLVRVEPTQALKLHRGTWHAGPFFKAESALFFNLELADTNANDHGFQSLGYQCSLLLH